MHYANGQEAKAGDLVFRDGKNNSDVETIGILVTAKAASDTCNGMMIPVLARGSGDAGVSGWVPCAVGAQAWYVTIKELLPVAVAPMPSPPTAAG